MSSPFLESNTELNQTIDNCVNALDKYLTKRKNSKDNLLWDEETDINLLIELKVNSLKAQSFNSIRIPLAHSFRGQDTDHEVCIITRTKDVEKWKEVLLGTYKIHNVSKIMSYKEFESEYKTQTSRLQLCHLFDLFILHPAIVQKVTSKIVPFLQSQNKSCAVLPLSYKLLNLGVTDHPLRAKKNSELESDENYADKLAKTIAKHRDSTFYHNYCLPQKFVKIGESGMSMQSLKENLYRVLQYGLCVIPNGGVSNVLRLSLHVNNTTVQLPFYVNLDAMDGHFEIAVPYSRPQTNPFLKKRKLNRLKQAMRKNCPNKVKAALVATKPMNNVTTLKFVKQCMP
eukprot:CAMPEP_0202695884 /NCGR_PEP_ID=MMETSP1385-20130828/9337_1 /ASSEMBLY_ACC=CAM_ASM_000861 /TAXON_ID=933848 /ORGANISM="Elphidium margaritaceum" /LENGTH=341 /DNA_ID=CAMNT_0049351963 /DNA_START=32 /DNA_END=1057 /DNA_ORIENTATION=-